MITEFKEVFENEETFKRIKTAIGTSRGAIMLLVHPFYGVGITTRASKAYPQEYIEALRKAVKQKKLPIFIFQETGAGIFGREELLEGIDATGREIIIVITDSHDPTPHRKSFGELGRRMDGEQRKELFVKTLLDFGVKKIFIGGEYGRYLGRASPKEKTAIDPRGCVPGTLKFLEKYSSIETVIMPKMLFHHSAQYI